MLTHNERLHDLDMSRHPKAENFLWRPDIQKDKVSETGMTNVRYRHRWKRQWLGQLLGWMGEAVPYCGVRYAFRGQAAPPCRTELRSAPIAGFTALS